MTPRQILMSYFDADDAQVVRSFGPTMKEVLVTWNGRKNMIAHRYRVVIRNESVESYKRL